MITLYENLEQVTRNEEIIADLFDMEYYNKASEPTKRKVKRALRMTRDRLYVSPKGGIYLPALWIARLSEKYSITTIETKTPNGYIIITDDYTDHSPVTINNITFNLSIPVGTTADDTGRIYFNNCTFNSLVDPDDDTTASISPLKQNKFVGCRFNYFMRIDMNGFGAGSATFDKCVFDQCDLRISYNHANGKYIRDIRDIDAEDLEGESYDKRLGMAFSTIGKGNKFYHCKAMVYDAPWDNQAKYNIKFIPGDPDEELTNSERRWIAYDYQFADGAVYILR